MVTGTISAHTGTPVVRDQMKARGLGIVVAA